MSFEDTTIATPADAAHASSVTQLATSVRADVLYAATTFLGALLLFQIEPMFAKVILPWFGGAASVWATCMLFFQFALLAGYGYAHWLTNSLGIRQQKVTHLSLIAASLIVLPIRAYESWKPAGTDDPSLRIIGLLAVSIGLPYFLLSTTGPLVQVWATRRNVTPYRLYAVSNFGSMLGLLSYPVLVEPFLSIRHQLIFWSVTYVLFLALCAVSALSGSRAPDLAGRSLDDAGQPPALRERLLWIALAACASALLLAVTNEITQNVAAVPFLWIVPLALYLLTFILCFGSDRWSDWGRWRWVLDLTIVLMCYAFYKHDSETPIYLLIPVFTGGLFICCMFCHGQLVARKPHPQHLTSFYLAIALGGALGSLFVGFGAPYVFRDFSELPVTIAAIAVMAWIARQQTARFAAAWPILTLLLFLWLGYQSHLEWMGSVPRRNFYGVIRTRIESNPPNPVRTISHGAIVHGEQLLDPARHMEPTTYYGRNSGVGLAIACAGERRHPIKVGVIGLGCGTLASYGRAADDYRFYEINPLVIEAARNEFTFLKDTPARTETVLGDARLSLEREPPQNFDVLAVDAFSGDAIPVHLLTREALAIYFRHLRPDGVLAIHLSNLHLDLVPVALNLARSVGKAAIHVDADGDDKADTFPSDWVLIADRDSLKCGQIEQAANLKPPTRKLRPWTDDYSNLFQIIK